MGARRVKKWGTRNPFFAPDHIKLLNQIIAWVWISVKKNAVGMLIAQHPPHRSVHEELPHTAPTSG